MVVQVEFVRYKWNFCALNLTRFFLTADRCSLSDDVGVCKFEDNRVRLAS